MDNDSIEILINNDIDVLDVDRIQRHVLASEEYNQLKFKCRIKIKKLRKRLKILEQDYEEIKSWREMKSKQEETE